MMWRQRLKPYAKLVGITSSKVLWQRIALSALRRKRAQDHAYREWLEGPGSQWITDHWVTVQMQDEFMWEQTASQIYELTKLLKARIGENGSGWCLDAGASDGSFLSLLGIKHGVGVNFLKVCARKIRADGQSAILADIERLPFANRSFQRVICCETLEHVPNPIATLNELERVCRGRIYLSIPWLPCTRMSDRPAGWPEVESHIFEFSEKDFRRIVAYTRLAISFSCTIQVFPEPRNPFLQWWLKQWMYPSYFPRLQYYELDPKH